NSELEDQILIKSDGMPTYNFANVVDDHAMAITHIIRGNEYLSSSPKYTLLYNDFGWDIPSYIHCPQVMKDSQHKLSKRDGDASYQELTEKGYLPAAILNYLALLGWAPKSEQEIFSLEQLISAFDISGISRSPAIFDIKKLNYINAEYIRALTPEQFKKHAMPFIKQAVKRDDIDFDVCCEVLSPRCEYFQDIVERLDFIDRLDDYSLELFVHKKMKTTIESSLYALRQILPIVTELDDFTKDNLHTTLFALIEELEVKNGTILFPLRVALSGKESTPGGGIELAVILGKTESLKRIALAIELLSNAVSVG
ncbi:MAG: glutamate--tRNA ligase family protein, partial [Oscillospiraceae bacterium]|nr:glutamate--tRNA ligase family protein [Oscillospiraceae bacterium]